MLRPREVVSQCFIGNTLRLLLWTFVPPVDVRDSIQLSVELNHIGERRGLAIFLNPLIHTLQKLVGPWKHLPKLKTLTNAIPIVIGLEDPQSNVLDNIGILTLTKLSEQLEHVGDGILVTEYFEHSSFDFVSHYF